MAVGVRLGVLRYGCRGVQVVRVGVFAGKRVEGHQDEPGAEALRVRRGDVWARATSAELSDGCSGLGEKQDGSDSARVKCGRSAHRRERKTELQPHEGVRCEVLC